jgi:hypothetical protein
LGKLKSVAVIVAFIAVVVRFHPPTPPKDRSLEYVIDWFFNKKIHIAIAFNLV